MNPQSSHPIARRLILHADDFGMNPAVNRGILAAFRDGLLTSTSVLANAPAFAPAMEAWNEFLRGGPLSRLPSAKARRRLGDDLLPFDLGIHLNLTQGRPLTENRFPSALLDDEGRFTGVFVLLRRLLAGGARFRPALRDELCAQIERVLDCGVTPTNLNGHQYVEMLPVVAGIIPELLGRYSIGVIRVPWERSLTRTTLLSQGRPAAWGLAQVKRLFAFDFLLRIRRCQLAHPDAFFGTAHAGRIDLATIRRFLDAAAGESIEIGLHPGEPVRASATTPQRDGWQDPLAALRPGELSLLTSSELQDMLAQRQVQLGRLTDLRASLPRSAAA